MGDYDRFQLI